MVSLSFEREIDTAHKVSPPSSEICRYRMGRNLFLWVELTFRTLFVCSRIRTEETTEANYPSDGLYEAVSETESEDEDEETSKEEPTANRRTHSPGNHRVSAARLSSSSGLSSSQATTTSSTASDADSGIDGVSPRVSAAAFGESTLSPSQSILYIDSISARNSVVHDTTTEEQQADDSTNDPEESSTLPTDEGTFTDPRASILVVEGDPRRDRAHRIALELLHTERTYVDILHLLDQVSWIKTMANRKTFSHIFSCCCRCFNSGSIRRTECTVCLPRI